MIGAVRRNDIPLTNPLGGMTMKNGIDEDILLPKPGTYVLNST